MRVASTRSLAVVLALTVLGCGDAEGPARPIDLGPAHRWEKFTLYYLGRNHRDLPLTGDGRDGLPPHAAGTRIEFPYGKCTPPAEQRCSLPLTVVNRPLCLEYPALERDNPADKMTRVRGVPAAIWYDDGNGRFDKLQLYTGETTVIIWAASLNDARRAAKGLRSLDGTVAPANPLEVPGPGFLEPTRQECRKANAPA